jgi:hypothetical protein
VLPLTVEFVTTMFPNALMPPAALPAVVVLLLIVELVTVTSPFTACRPPPEFDELPPVRVTFCSVTAPDPFWVKTPLLAPVAHVWVMLWP